MAADAVLGLPCSMWGDLCAHSQPCTLGTCCGVRAWWWLLTRELSAPLFAASWSWFRDQGLFPDLAGEGSHDNYHTKIGVASQIMALDVLRRALLWPPVWLQPRDRTAASCLGKASPAWCRSFSLPPLAAHPVRFLMNQQVN